VSFEQSRQQARQKLWELLRNRSDSYVPMGTAVDFLYHCDRRNERLHTEDDVQAMGRMLSVDMWCTACELEGCEAVPELRKHYRSADGACSVELLWSHAKKRGLADALALIRQAEAERMAFDLPSFSAAMVPVSKDTAAQQSANGTSDETNLSPMPEAARGIPRKTLVDRHRKQWPTIEADISKASENGLAAQAKAGDRGWIEAEAIAWAEQAKRLVEVHQLQAVWAGSFRSDNKG